MSEQELAKALAGLNESSPNRWRLQQELYRRAAVASIPPPKWHDGWLGKIAIGVIGFPAWRCRVIGCSLLVRAATRRLKRLPQPLHRWRPGFDFPGLGSEFAARISSGWDSAVPYRLTRSSTFTITSYVYTGRGCSPFTASSIAARSLLTSWALTAGRLWNSTLNRT